MTFTVVRTAVDQWFRHRSARLGAALAYYSVFSMGLLGLTTGLLLAGSSLVFAQTSPAPAPTPEGPPAAKTTGTQQLWYSRQAVSVPSGLRP
jgi:hypothetical protein